MIFSPAAVNKVHTLRTSLASDPFPGPSSTSCSCLGWPAPIHSLRIHTPTSWNKPENMFTGFLWLNWGGVCCFWWARCKKKKKNLFSLTFLRIFRMQLPETDKTEAETVLWLTVYSVGRKTNRWEFDVWFISAINSVLNQRILVCFN